MGLRVWRRLGWYDRMMFYTVGQVMILFLRWRGKRRIRRIFDRVKKMVKPHNELAWKLEAEAFFGKPAEKGGD